MAAPKGTRPPNAGKGRKPGVPNKSTADIRAAVALLLEGNIDKLHNWLTAVAEGEKEPALARDGKPLKYETGEPVMRWRREPNPGGAMRLVMDRLEYHVPKLARTEMSGEAGTRGILTIIRG